MKEILFLGSYLSKNRGTKGPGEFVAEKLNEEGFECRNISRKNSPIFRAVESILSILFRHYDVAIVEVYSSRVIYLTWLLSFLIWLRRRRYIAILHGGAIPEKYPSIKRFLDPILQRSARVVTPSKFIRQFFAVANKDIHYLPNPFPIENFPYEKPALMPPRLLWVRAFSPIYQPDLAVRILYELRKIYPDVTLTMVGPDKGVLAAVRKLISKWGLQEAVSIVGPVPNEKLFRYFHSHSVFLNTTAYESFGVAVMEAAACGIPVVSTPAGEIPLLWENGKELLITDNWDANEMADAIKSLLQDSEKAESLRQQARKKAEEFDWEIIKGMWIKLLKSDVVS